MAQQWTDKETDGFINDYYSKPIPFLIKKYKRSHAALFRRAAHLEFPEVYNSGGQKNQHWSTKEDDYLFEGYHTKSIVTIAKKLGRSTGGVHGRIITLGLHKATEDVHEIVVHKKKPKVSAPSVYVQDPMGYEPAPAVDDLCYDKELRKALKKKRKELENVSFVCISRVPAKHKESFLAFCSSLGIRTTTYTKEG